MNKVVFALFLFVMGQARAQQAEIEDREHRPPSNQSQKILSKPAKDSATVYRIPFASKGNTLELTLTNTTGGDLGDITITAQANGGNTITRLQKMTLIK